MEKYYIIYYFSTKKSNISGYYVGWKTKLTDEYSELSINANKYKSLSSLLINKLNIKSKFIPLDEFSTYMEQTDALYQRLLKISKVKKTKFIPFFSNDIWNKMGFRIDIIETDVNDNFKITTLNPNVLYEFLCKKKEKYRLKIKKEIPLCVRIDKLDEHDSFWD